MQRQTSFLLILMAALVCLTGLGCEMERRVIKRNPWTEMFERSEWYDGPAEEGEGAVNNRDRGYAVELASYTGGEAFQRVPTLIREAREQGGLAELWYASTGDRTTVYAGKFRDPESDEAETALRLARSAHINGARPFEDAQLVKLTAERGEVLDPHDARTHSGKGRFALQVGYFDRSFGTDYRVAAEQTARLLRDQGEEAYYYHGPNRSLILLHAWARREAFVLVGQHDRYSNLVKSVQEQYPHNVPNGKPFTDADDPTFVRSQHSFLVQIR